MNISAPFIRRPIGTTLLSIGLFLVGVVSYFQLPVASLPAVDFPAIRVQAARPGADPGIMAATVAAPLERRLGEISGVNEMTSNSTLGSSSITLQFDLSRNVDDAARDVQAALNAAVTDLPGDLPTLPVYRKANSASFPVFILALTSDTLPTTALYDAADTVIAQKISQIDGVAEVTVNGAAQPAIRVRIDPQRLAAMGLSVDTVRTAIGNANVGQAIGSFDGPDLTETLATSDSLSTPEDFGAIVLRSQSGTIVRLADVATVERGNKSRRAAGWFNKRPSVLLIVTKQPKANVIDTVDRVRALLPELKRWVPAGVDIAIFTDRTVTIRAAVRDIQITLLITCALVMGVVFLFLRRATPTLAAGVAVPLSLAGTVACMWVAGFSLDNLSLMAITISVGFVVDDAIVMIENVTRNIERGMSPIAAALLGSKQIGFTVISISLSLVAAFVPLLFMGGIVGSFFREFSLTLTFAVVVSTLVSLTLTPMVCAHFMKRHDHRPPNLLDRAVESGLASLVAGYARTLRVALRHPWLMVLVMILTIGLTVELFKVAPKGFVPEDDTGLIMGQTEAAADISFPAMAKLQQGLADVILRDPAVDGVGSFIGGGGGVNSGQLFISLKPEGQRPTAAQVIDRLRKKLARRPGITLFMIPIQDLRAGGRSGKGSYQFTLWDADLDELQTWQPKVLDRLKTIPGVVDLSTDREQGGLEAEVVIDRPAAARLGVAIQSIDDALSDAFGERQISTIYGQRNQYRVVLEVAPRDQQDPSDLSRIYVPGSGGTQVPLSAFTTVVRRASPLVVNHQGAFPSVTLTYNLAPGTTLETSSDAIRQAVARDAPARRVARGVRRRRPGVPAGRGRPRPADPGRHRRHLHHPGRALREPDAPVDDPLHPALGGIGRIAGPSGGRHGADRHRLHRHHPADRHRQEERHHAGGLRHPCRARPGHEPSRRHLRGLSRTLPADPDDHLGGPVRRHADRLRDGRRSGAAPAARRHHHGRTHSQPGPDALYDAHHLPRHGAAVAHPLAVPTAGDVPAARAGRGVTGA